MGYINSAFPQLGGWSGSFTIEILASILKPEWIQEALQTTGRRTRSMLKLSVPFTI